MLQWILVYIIIAISAIYILYKVWQALHQKPEGGCTGYCPSCPLAADASRKRFSTCKKDVKEMEKRKNITKKETKNLED